VPIWLVLQRVLHVTGSKLHAYAGY
jgi:hypothetical protein